MKQPLGRRRGERTFRMRVVTMGSNFAHIVFTLIQDLSPYITST